jgi:hypothetical protein
MNKSSPALSKPSIGPQRAEPRHSTCTPGANVLLVAELDVDRKRGHGQQQRAPKSPATATTAATAAAAAAAATAAATAAGEDSPATAATSRTPRGRLPDGQEEGNSGR